MHSPRAATRKPAPSDSRVGRARASITAAATKPSATRRRATVRTRLPEASAMDAQAPAHALDDSVDTNVVDAPRIAAALALVQAYARGDARQHDVVRRPWSVALGIRRAEQRDERSAHRAADMQRPR